MQLPVKIRDPWLFVASLVESKMFDLGLKKRGLFLGPFFLKTDAAGRLFILIYIQQKTDAGTFLSREIPEMESRINKLANITGNGPQPPSETTWSLPIMMLRNWKSVFFFFFFFRKQ